MSDHGVNRRRSTTTNGLCPRGHGDITGVGAGAGGFEGAGRKMAASQTGASRRVYGKLAETDCPSWDSQVDVGWAHRVGSFAEQGEGPATAGGRLVSFDLPGLRRRDGRRCDAAPRPAVRRGAGESRWLDRLLEGVIEVAAAVEQPGGLNRRGRRGTRRHEPSPNGRRGRVFRPGPVAPALLTLWPLTPWGGHPSP